MSSQHGNTMKDRYSTRPPFARTPSSYQSLPRMDARETAIDNTLYNTVFNNHSDIGGKTQLSSNMVDEQQSEDNYYRCRGNNLPNVCQQGDHKKKAIYQNESDSKFRETSFCAADTSTQNLIPEVESQNKQFINKPYRPSRSMAKRIGHGTILHGEICNDRSDRDELLNELHKVHNTTNIYETNDDDSDDLLETVLAKANMSSFKVNDILDQSPELPPPPNIRDNIPAHDRSDLFTGMYIDSQHSAFLDSIIKKEELLNKSSIDNVDTSQTNGASKEKDDGISTGLLLKLMLRMFCSLSQHVETLDHYFDQTIRSEFERLQEEIDRQVEEPMYRLDQLQARVQHLESRLLLLEAEQQQQEKQEMEMGSLYQADARKRSKSSGQLASKPSHEVNVIVLRDGMKLLGLHVTDKNKTGDASQAMRRDLPSMGYVNTANTTRSRSNSLSSRRPSTFSSTRALRTATTSTASQSETSSQGTFV